MKAIIILAIQYALVFGLTCLAVLVFAAAFNFEWSFMLCLASFMALCAAKWVFYNGDE